MIQLNHWLLIGWLPDGFISGRINLKIFCGDFISKKWLKRIIEISRQKKLNRGTEKKQQIITLNFEILISCMHPLKNFITSETIVKKGPELLESIFYGFLFEIKEINER